MGLLKDEGAVVLPRSASEVATELIREAIFEGRLEPAQRLKEEELASELGVSRTPVREALLILQAEGLVCAAPNRGAVVRTYTEEDLVDMYEIRALLEGFAAHHAALRITAEQLAVLAESCDRFKSLRKSHDLTGLIRENILFHSTIVEAAGTTKLAELVRLAFDLPLIYRSFYWFTDKETQLSERAHRHIVKALAAGDADGTEHLMKEHISFGRDFLVGRLHAGALNGAQYSATKRRGNSAGASRSPQAEAQTAAR